MCDLLCADAEFNLVPAVRRPTGSCVDESGCSWEAATSCVFKRLDTMAANVTFLACMDESRSSDPVAAAATCAPDVGKSTIESCATGPEGKALLAAASAAFNDALPGSTTIPHTFVDQSDVQPDYSALKKALCKAGSKAPACSKAAPNVV